MMDLNPEIDTGILQDIRTAGCWMSARSFTVSTIE